MRTIQLAIMAVALVMAAQVHAGLTDLINNGNFNNTQGTFSPNHTDPGAMNVLPGQTYIPGWTVETSPVSWDNSANPYGLTGANGSSYFLDLTGWQDKSPFGQVSQTINTTVGQAYQLTFFIGSSTTYDAKAPGIDLKITGIGAAGSPGSDYYTTLSGKNNWQQFTVDFTAGKSQTTLYFKGLSGGGSFTEYIGLDNVHLTAVPESTTVFAGIGALCLVLFGAGVHSKRSVIRIGK